jgi:diaminopimelate decarboxylase
VSATLQRLDECLSIRDDVLYVEECAAQDLAERFGTPLYVVSEDQLRRNARRFQVAFESRWPGEFLLLPSIKANSSLALRRILSDEGTGCDVFGPGELAAALRTGTDPAQISLNGPMKDSALLERAIRAGVGITLDSRAELDRTAAAAARLGIRARIRLRFRPDLVGLDQPSEMSPEGLSISAAIQRYKAGIPTEDILAITEADIRDPNLDLAGIHLHLGRHSTEPTIWSAAIDSLADLLERLRTLWGGWTPRELDLGGGYPVPRDPFGRRLPLRADAPPRAPAVDAYAEAICPRLAGRLERLGIAPGDVRLELEPGRAIYADAGVHLATVGNVKRQTTPMPLTWVETDSSDAYLPDVNLEFNRWTCLPVQNAAAQPAITADVTGRTCALDVIVSDAELPEVEAGDVLAFLDTGAYQEVGATNFNALPRPGTALVSGDSAELIRRHETLEEVFARDMIPARLQNGAGEMAGGAGWRATGLDHVSVTSGDLDRSLSFYRDLLGLELRARGEAEGSSEFEITGITGAKVRWADLQLPYGQTLELIEYAEPTGTPSRPEPNDPGATHISLRVADADATYVRLRKAGVGVRSEPVTIDAPGAWNGVRAFYATDPDGVTVELVQPSTRAGT